MNKKAALELSMNTIVIIVIGVTVLSLGLVFVKGMMDRLIGISDDSLDRADSEIARMWGQIGEPLTLIPEDLTVEINGKSGIVYVVLYNDEGIAKQVTATVTGDPTDPNVKCVFGDTKTSQSNTYNLEDGGKEKIKLLVQAEKGASTEDAVCNINVGEESETLIIYKEAGGFF